MHHVSNKALKENGKKCVRENDFMSRMESFMFVVK